MKRAFAILFGKIEEKMNEVKLLKSLRRSLWTKCANTATYIDNLVVSNNVSLFQAFYDAISKYINNLKILVKWELSGNDIVIIKEQGNHNGVFGLYQRPYRQCFQVPEIKTKIVMLRQGAI